MSGGIPLGFVLEPPLFLTNVNVLPNEAEQHLNMFAGDAKIIQDLWSNRKRKILQGH